MLNIKKDFPIFANNPGMVFLDSGASSQKPQYVIDGVNKYVSNDYANIHRGQYSLSEKSDDIYEASKNIIAKHLHCSADEIFYSYNATYGINMVAQSLKRSNFFSKGDKILIGIWDHHANIVPWQIVAKDLGLEIEFIMLKDNADDNYDIDRNNFSEKYDEKVRLVAVGHVSNVTGQIYNIKKIKSKLRDDTFLLIDGSQSVPHFKVDVQDIDCDCFVFTGHKMMSYTGIGVVYLKKECIKRLNPVFSGGGAIKDVTIKGVSFLNNYMKFEPGTPDIIGAVSLLKAFEYIENIGGYKAIQEHETTLVKYCVKKFKALKKTKEIKLLGSYSSENRIGVFSFYIPNQMNFNLVGEYFAEHNICIRSGGHCAYPLHRQSNINGTNRMSLYIYNTIKEIDKFFEVLKEYLN